MIPDRHQHALSRMVELKEDLEEATAYVEIPRTLITKTYSHLVDLARFLEDDPPPPSENVEVSFEKALHDGLSECLRLLLHIMMENGTAPDSLLGDCGTLILDIQKEDGKDAPS